MAKGNPHPKKATPDNPDLLGNKLKETKEKPEEIKQAIKNAMMFAGDFHDMEKRRVYTAEEIADRLNWYFELCQETGQLPTVEKMALSLGHTRDYMYKMQKGSHGKEVAEMIVKAKEIIATMDAELASTGTLQPIIYIFRAKNYYGMRDQVDIQTTSVDLLADDMDKKKLEAKYANVIDAETVTKEIGINGQGQDKGQGSQEATTKPQGSPTEATKEAK